MDLKRFLYYPKLYNFVFFALNVTDIFRGFFQSHHLYRRIELSETDLR